MPSEFYRDITEELFQTQTFQPKSTGCLIYQGTHKTCLIDTSSVKKYNQKKIQTADFNLPQTKQLFELSNTIKNFNQFSKNACQNANYFQAFNIIFSPLLY